MSILLEIYNGSFNVFALELNLQQKSVPTNHNVIHATKLHTYYSTIQSII